MPGGDPRPQRRRLGHVEAELAAKHPHQMRGRAQQPLLLAARADAAKHPAMQLDEAALGEPLDHQVHDEVGFRRGLLPLAVRRQHAGRRRLGDEVEGACAAELMVAEAPPLVVSLFQSESVAGDGEGARAKREGLQAAIAEPDVGDPPLPRDLDQQHQVVAEHQVAHHLAHHRAGRTGDLEADRLQYSREEAIHFVAPAAAATRDDLLEGGFGIDADRTAELDVQVFVGDGQEVGAMKRAQSRQVRPRVARIADPFEIGLEVHSKPRTITGADQAPGASSRSRLSL